MSESSSETTRNRIIRLAFDGDAARFHEFLEELGKVTPESHAVILRGSAVTGKRWSDGQPFDADGPGTSDLDVTFLGAELIDHWTEFYIPKMHTVPLSEEHPDSCPALVGLRRRLCDLAGRPVNLQASKDFVQYARDVLFDQPYFTLIGSTDEDHSERAAS